MLLIPVRHVSEHWQLCMCAVLADADAALPDGAGHFYQGVRVHSGAGRCAASERGCRNGRCSGCDRPPAFLLRTYHPGGHPYGHRGEKQLLEQCTCDSRMNQSRIGVE